MKEFYFDTANLEFIKSTSDQLINKIDSKLIKGVTITQMLLVKLSNTAFISGLKQQKK